VQKVSLNANQPTNQLSKEQLLYMILKICMMYQLTLFLCMQLVQVRSI